MSYKSTLNIFFLLVIFEGALRKWVFIDPSLGVLIQLIRDSLPLLSLLLFIQKNGLNNLAGYFYPAMMFFLRLYILWGCLEFFNPLTDSSIISLIGIKTHFAYIPLLFLMPHYLGSWEEGKSKINFLLAISIPICLLAAYQTTMPPYSAINRYASGAVPDAFFGGMVRATGTFSYITGMAVFAQLVAATSILSYFDDENSVRRKLFLISAAAIGLMGCISTGSRGCLLSVIVSVLVWVIAQKKVVRILIAISKLGWILSLSIFGLVMLASDQISSFLDRLNTAGDHRVLDDRVYLTMFEWLKNALDYPLGTGIGMGHQMASRFIGMGSGFHGGEAELSRVAYELGAVGILIFLSFRLVVFVGIWKRLKTINDNLRPMLALSLALLVPLAAGAVYVPISNAFFWVIIGFSIWVYRFSLVDHNTAREHVFHFSPRNN